MNTPPFEIITPESATSASGKSSLGDVRPLVQRDPLYYEAPLIILVSCVVVVTTYE